MHDDNNNNGFGGKGMMWMMVLCCALPFLLILTVGAGGRALGASNWIILGAVVVMAAVHLYMMWKSHKSKDNPDNSSDKKDEPKKHDCCH